MKTLSKTADARQLVDRIRRLTPDSGRRWGQMSSHQMICHLIDSFKVGMGTRPASPLSTPLSRTIVKWVALYSRLPWPKGVPTRPEVDQQLGGTKPGEFDIDLKELVTVVEQFAAKDGFEYAAHPVFGPLTAAEWLRWGYLHADHHLRQFGA
jgi:hypothetical protein